jgi:hypothetical protein
MKNPFRLIVPGLTSIAVALPLLASAAPDPSFALEHANVKEVIAVQTVFTPGLMAQPEILGTAVGQDPDGEAVLVIYVNMEAANHGEVMRTLPLMLRGKLRPSLPTGLWLTANWRIKPGRPPSHTPPYRHLPSNWHSGGWGYDLANGYCCGEHWAPGSDRSKSIFYNYHVFESDIVLGGNDETANTGDDYSGLIDVGCAFANAQIVAMLRSNLLCRVPTSMLLLPRLKTVR